MAEAPWTRAGDAALLEAASRVLLRVQGREIAVFKQGEALFAMDDSCPHSGASLCVGRIDAGHVRCPAHGLRFRLTDGHIAGSSTEGSAGRMAVRVFPVRVVTGAIELQLGQ